MVFFSETRPKILYMFLWLKDLFSMIVLLLDSWRTRIIFRNIISCWKFSFSVTGFCLVTETFEVEIWNKRVSNHLFLHSTAPPEWLVLVLPGWLHQVPNTNHQGWKNIGSLSKGPEPRLWHRRHHVRQRVCDLRPQRVSAVPRVPLLRAPPALLHFCPCLFHQEMGWVWVCLEFLSAACCVLTES